MSEEHENKEIDWIVYDNWQVAPEDIDRALRGSEVCITVPGSDQKLVVTTEEVTDDDVFGSGMKRTWDDEDCPHDGCGGELQHQDRFNVMCLECESAWSHVRQPSTDSSPEKHLLQDADGEVVEL